MGDAMTMTKEAPAETMRIHIICTGYNKKRQRPCEHVLFFGAIDRVVRGISIKCEDCGKVTVFD